MNAHEKAQTVFKIMVEQSEDDIWEGRLTHIVNELGFSSYYGRIVAFIRNSGAAEQIARGAMGVPSRWRILDSNSDLKPEPGPRKGIVPKRDPLEARIAALEKMLGGLDIPLAFSDIIRRMDMLEKVVLNGQADRDRPEASDSASQSV